jgi:hypothetical protein
MDAIAGFSESQALGVYGSCSSHDANKLIILGHSNGGQGECMSPSSGSPSLIAFILGAWYFMERFPDRVIGGIPASGYVKIQDYVPYTQSIAAHFQDPNLRGVSFVSLFSQARLKWTEYFIVDLDERFDAI